MPHPIIDAHAHLWLKQDAVWDGEKIQTMTNGKSRFMGSVRQMLPPYMTDGRNTVERLIANMDYARVASAVITQEYIDGFQNEYLLKVQKRFPERLKCCGLVDMSRRNPINHFLRMQRAGFQGFKVPAGRLIMRDRRIYLTDNVMMEMFKRMQCKGDFLSIDLADGDVQVAEMKEVIAECPKLRIAIGHFGMVTRAGWKEQIKLALNPNVSIESGGITWLFHNEFYPYPSAMKAIREAADHVGIDKLMWGSDYPRTMTEITYKMSYDFVSKSALLDMDEKSKFLGMNARRFYKFRRVITPNRIKNMLED
jgi:predicted TIM-barrel fold metal-dependent hydrolase